ncbi:MAG: hypothetical protein M1503_12965 [Thaumarchaeota archaeon]|nr:hypothetical protein [Nitrososphaerota archaeon]MCL5319149.1 hypothetical protein [Nitrososphaerota archaeon]
MSPYIDLFGWWVGSISWSIIFLIVISIYLYNKANNLSTTHISRLAKDFVFVWILLSLLVFYIISVSIGSPALFAAGNIIVELILILYALKSRTKKAAEPTPQS